MMDNKRVSLVYGDTLLTAWYAFVWQWKWWKTIEKEVKMYKILDI